MNEKFGAGLTAGDESLFTGVRADATADEDVVDLARSNSREKFTLGIETKLDGLLADRHDQNATLIARMLEDRDFRGVAVPLLAKAIYEEARRAA